MDFEVVAIGNELLLGFTVDTNGGDIGAILAEVGAQVVRRCTVPDTADGIRDGVSEALARTGRVITTGGLGPTKDDITKKAVADLFGVPLDFDETIWQDLQARYARLIRRSPDRNRCQAEVPRGAVVLPNRWGSAPGLWLEGPAGLVVMLPGVPMEMRNLMTQEVVPRLDRGGDVSVIRSRVLRTAGIGESTLAETVGDIEDTIAPVSLAYLPGEAWVDLRLTAWKEPLERADRLLEDAANAVRVRIGSACYGEGDADLAAVLLDDARRAGYTVAVAESCTGGMVGQRLTAIAGSSDVFRGGVIAYDDAVKRDVLDVPESLLREHGAVSEPVARAMADGAARVFGTDLAIAITGIAGPTGGSDDKPVGTVWHGYHCRGRTETVHRIYPGDRAGIRVRATMGGLVGMRRLLKNTLEGDYL